MLSLAIFPDNVVEDSSIKRVATKWSPFKFGNIEISVVVELYLEVDALFSKILSKLLIISTMVSEG